MRLFEKLQYLLEREKGSLQDTLSKPSFCWGDSCPIKETSYLRNLHGWTSSKELFRGEAVWRSRALSPVPCSAPLSDAVTGQLTSPHRASPLKHQEHVRQFRWKRATVETHHFFSALVLVGMPGAAEGVLLGQL